MGKRVSVPRSELEKVRKELKDEEGFSINEISDAIGVNFKNCLYGGYNMSLESFETLKQLSDRDIDFEVVDHRNGVSYDKRLESLNKSQDLAEFFGMMLGDGHIQNYYAEKGGKHVTNYRVQMSFNEDEKEIIKRGEKLFSEVIGKEPSFHSDPNSKGMRLTVYSKDLVDELQRLGLEAGDKTENQVSVPGWIKIEENYQIKCLKGLTDTDGTIFERVPGDKVIQFKNASRPLLKDFEELCDNLGISTSKGGYRTVQVAANDDVRRFIRLIQPIKSKRV